MNEKTPLDRFLTCWNSYSDTVFYSNGEINSRVSSLDVLSKICDDFGGREFALTNGLKIIADYVLTSKRADDYVIGFKAILYGADVGLIQTISLRGKILYISTDRLAFCMDVSKGEEIRW